MRGHPTVFVLTLVLLLSAGTARAGIEACAAVRDGRAEAVFLHQDSTRPGSPNVGAVLKRPAGPGPHPAMIVLHGNGGLRAPRCYEGSLDLLVGWGYAALAVDSLTGRIAQGGYSFAEQSADAVRALAWLQQRLQLYKTTCAHIRDIDITVCILLHFLELLTCLQSLWSKTAMPM